MREAEGFGSWSGRLRGARASLKGKFGFNAFRKRQKNSELGRIVNNFEGRWTTLPLPWVWSSEHSARRRQESMKPHSPAENQSNNSTTQTYDRIQHPQYPPEPGYPRSPSPRRRDQHR